MNDGFRWDCTIPQWHDLFVNGKRVAYMTLAVPYNNQWSVFMYPYTTSTVFYLLGPNVPSSLDEAKAHVEEMVLLKMLEEGKI